MLYATLSELSENAIGVTRSCIGVVADMLMFPSIE